MSHSFDIFMTTLSNVSFRFLNECMLVKGDLVAVSSRSRLYARSVIRSREKEVVIATIKVEGWDRVFEGQMYIWYWLGTLYQAIDNDCSWLLCQLGEPNPNLSVFKATCDWLVTYPE